MPARNPERKRAQAKRSFVALCARNIAPRPLPHPSPHTRRARGRPQGGCGNEQESRGGWAKCPRSVPRRPAPPRATGLRLLRQVETARAALKRESKKRRSGAKRRSGKAPASRPNAAPGIARRAPKRLWPFGLPRAPSKTSHRPMTKFAATNRRTLETPAGPPAARRDSLPRKGARRADADLRRFDGIACARPAPKRRSGEKAKRRRPAVRRSMPLALDQARAAPASAHETGLGDAGRAEACPRLAHPSLAEAGA